MKFRAIVMHLNDPELYPSYEDALKRVASRLNAFTVRAVLTKPSDNVDLELVSVYAGEGIKGFERARELLEKGYFTSVSIGKDPSTAPLEYAATFILRIAKELGPEYNVRFSIATGEPYEGPYFPATKTNNFGISASLLYPSDLYDTLREAEEPNVAVRHVMSTIFSEAEKKLTELLREEGIPYLGIDFSLSPWMEESAALAISLMARSDFLSPGTPSAILELNKSISSAVSGRKAIGFNEVMLPMAEDNVLREMALSGQLTVKDLAYLTPYCVAGLDMVALPLDVNLKDVAKLISDVMAASYVKNRVLGVRILLIDGKEGDEVNLEMFGNVPIMRLG